MRHATMLLVFAITVALLSCAGRSPLLQPTPGELASAGPDSFRVDVVTTRGAFALMVHRDWSPYGADRVYFLVTNNYYDEARIYRVVKGFVAQFGISGNPLVSAVWKNQRIPDDHVLRNNTRGVVSFARSSRDSRTTQLFINLANNPQLDTAGGFGFPPVAEVVEGMSVVDSVYAGYGEGPPKGQGPAQDSIGTIGNDYLKRAFPLLDYIRTARVTRSWGGGPSGQLRRGLPPGRGRGGAP
jgi:peptidyl-prolyl cis-trans isomerase A (cyclophilin A)